MTFLRDALGFALVLSSAVTLWLLFALVLTR